MNTRSETPTTTMDETITGAESAPSDTLAATGDTLNAAQDCDTVAAATPESLTGNAEADTVTETADQSASDTLSAGPVSIDQGAAALATHAAVAALTPATPEEDHPVNNAEAFLTTLEDDGHILVKEAVAHIEALLALIKRITSRD